MAASSRSMPTQPPPSPVPQDDAQEILADFSSDSSSEGFNLITPRKRRTTSQRNESKAKRTNNKRTPPVKPGTSTQNRFDPLTEPEDTPTTDQPGTDDEELRTAPANRRKAPPPIILCGKPEEHRKLIEYLKKIAPSGFHIKYTTNNANIFITDNNERKLVISDLALKQMPFFTYSASTDKTHGYVIRGLDSAPEPAELLDELKLHGVNALQAFKMRTVARPLYLVVTSSDVVLKNLQQNIKYLFYTRVEWERHINKKIISQCHKCQKWGHATSNCFMPAVCLKCAGPHPTASCKKPIDLPAKCANCSQDHPANSTSCPVYKRRIEERAARQQRTLQRTQPRGAQARPAFIDAPLPVRNIWAERAAAHQPAHAQPPRQHTYAQRPATHTHAQLNQNDTTHLLSLPQPHPQQQSPQQPPSQQPTPQIHPPTPTQQPSPTTHNPGLNKITDLMQQMQLLSQKVNIDGILQALKDLNKQLESATDQASKFMTFVNFTQDINKYNI